MSFDGGAEVVIDGEVQLLHLEGFLFGDADADIRLSAEGTAAFTRHADDGNAECLGNGDSVGDVLCVARGRECDEDIARFGKSENGLCVDQLGIDVIAKGGVEASNGGERDGGKPRLERRKHILRKIGGCRPHARLFLGIQGALFEKALHQLADNMVTVGTASAVAAKKYLATVFVTGDYFFGCLCNICKVRREMNLLFV